MNAKERATSWLVNSVDQQTQEEIQQLIAEDGVALQEAFFQDLEFGTGGLRGVMGIGSTRINRYTIGAATQGLADYLKKQYPAGSKVAIAYDSRNQSDTLARAAADVLTGNGITVYLFRNLRPTPVLSFAVRQLGCQSGIVITASHNPPEYNGYKVYWSDGGQVVPPHDKGIIQCVRSVGSFDNVQFKGNDELLHFLEADWDQHYLDMALPLIRSKSDIAAQCNVPMVYTSIHGAGITMVPQLLEKMGFKNVHIVAEQAEPDGNFSTVKSPNPEEKEALALAIQLAEKTNSEWVLGTDPDTDRVGLCVKDNQGKMALLNGNQTGALLAYYQLQMAGKIHPSGLPYFTARTIVTSTLIEEIASSFGVPCYSTLTGFKYIAAVIAEREGKEKFLCGGEESYGYLIGDDVRDKDAVISAAALSEIGAWALNNGSSLWGLLMEIYERYGLFHEELVSITLKGLDGMEKIKSMMDNFRNHAPKTLGGVAVVETRDYWKQEKTGLDGSTQPIELPASNVMQFVLSDGSTITARPSGTEPKIKFYFSMKEAFLGQDQYAEQVRKLQEKMKVIEKEMIG
ncbi:MAG: hypothetical protein RL062_772 [Bacteroidota bacterium]